MAGKRLRRGYRARVTSERQATGALGALLVACVLHACDRRPERAPNDAPAPAPSPANSSAAVAPASPAGSSPAMPTGGTPPPEKSAAPLAAPFAGTAGISELKREGEPRLLRSVRAADNVGYDRVVFEFADGIPGYHVEYVDKPVRDCGAGEVKPVAGDAWLEVRFYPANAHTEQGEPTVEERELHPALPVVREVERTCDFEGVVTWVIGTASPNRYRAFELASPPRLVVDILHSMPR